MFRVCLLDGGAEMDTGAASAMDGATLPQAAPQILAAGQASAAETAASDPKERRTAERFRTVFRVAKVAGKRVSGLWRVRNISDFGMMMLTHARLKVGEKLSIALSDNVSVDGKVVWFDGDRCGVAFDRQIDSADILKTLGEERTSARYRAPRLPTDLHAVAYCERGMRPIRIVDISQHGLGFTHNGCFKSGMKTLVMFANGIERRGIVRWATADRAGLMLLVPFTCDELEGMSPPAKAKKRERNAANGAASPPPPQVDA